MAQELKLQIPQAVDRNVHDEYFVNYNQVVPVLIEAIKEQQAIIERLEARIQKLEID